MESLSLESTTFERVVKDDTISKILDKVVHPTQDVLDLMDFQCLTDAWHLQMFNVQSAKYTVNCGRQSGEYISLSIFASRDVGDGEALELHL